MDLSQHILWFDTLASTNDTLKQMSPTGLQEGMVVATRYQSRGKGQQGNTWESAAGQNLLCSVALMPEQLAANNSFMVAKVVALGISGMLEQMGVPNTIKWPNDIYVGQKKICGVLIEQAIRGGCVADVVVGIGLNVNQQQFAHAPNPTSIRLETGQEHEVETVLARMLRNLYDQYALLRAGEYHEISKRYLHRLYRLGEWHGYIIQAHRVEGRILGVDSLGQLMLEERSGEVHLLAFKQVAFVH